MNLAQFDETLQSLLRIPDFERADASWNGIQVSCSEKEIQSVAVAVDAAAETIERAIAWGADALFVHHGLFWGRAERVTGIHHARLSSLLKADVALYAVHLPLDAHEELGNNARMASALELQEITSFGAYKGMRIGVQGTLPNPMTTLEVSRALFGTTEDLLGVLPFGKEHNSRIGIISGGAPRDVAQAIDEGLDLFVTGDAAHTIYHHCLEAGINVMFGGHYRTETWGVAAVAEWLTREHGIRTTFVDVPTGL